MLWKNKTYISSFSFIIAKKYIFCYFLRSCSKTLSWSTLKIPVIYPKANSQKKYAHQPQNLIMHLSMQNVFYLPDFIWRPMKVKIRKIPVIHSFNFWIYAWTFTALVFTFIYIFHRLTFTDLHKDLRILMKIKIKIRAIKNWWFTRTFKKLWMTGIVRQLSILRNS